MKGIATEATPRGPRTARRASARHPQCRSRSACAGASGLEEALHRTSTRGPRRDPRPAGRRASLTAFLRVGAPGSRRAPLADRSRPADAATPRRPGARSRLRSGCSASGWRGTKPRRRARVPPGDGSPARTPPIAARPAGAVAALSHDPLARVEQGMRKDLVSTRGLRGRARASRAALDGDHHLRPRSSRGRRGPASDAPRDRGRYALKAWASAAPSALDGLRRLHEALDAFLDRAAPRHLAEHIGGAKPATADASPRSSTAAAERFEPLQRFRAIASDFCAPWRRRPAPNRVAPADCGGFSSHPGRPDVFSRGRRCVGFLLRHGALIRSKYRLWLHGTAAIPESHSTVMRVSRVRQDDAQSEGHRSTRSSNRSRSTPARTG
jgi:hypothetical protein